MAVLAMNGQLIGATSGGGSNGQIKYSTEESAIGKWGGQTLYQKVLEGTLDNAGTTIISHGINNLDKCIIVGGYIKNTDSAGTTNGLMQFGTVEGIKSISIMPESIYLNKSASNSYGTSNPYVIVLNYTKTCEDPILTPAMTTYE